MSGALRPGSDVIHERVALGVWPRDPFTGRRGEARLRMRVRGRPELRPSLSRSGVYAFSQLSTGSYWLDYQPIGADADRYLPGSLTVTLDGVGAPLRELRLDLNPAYPFPRHAALLRGRVTAVRRSVPRSRR